MTGEVVVKRIVAEYRAEAWMYDRLARLVARFLRAKVALHFRDAGWPVLHHVQHRAKGSTSLYKNLLGHRYEVPWDKSEDLGSSALWGKVKDLAGARLILYFRCDLDEFIEQKEKAELESWFGSESGVVHRRQIEIHDPRNRVQEVFGYDSYHFAVRVTPGTEFWSALTAEDHLMFARRFQCEVQMRTVLQHAWAEAEHDLRYKGLHKSKRGTRLWGVISAVLESADYLIAERQLEDRPEKESIAATEISKSSVDWSYGGSTFVGWGGIEIAGTAYGYKTLHNWHQPPLEVRETDTLFNVDKAVQRRIGLQDYKVRMWSQLRRDSRAFSEALHFDGAVARAAGWDAAGNTLLVQPALYSDQMVTNHREALVQTIEGMHVGRLGYAAGESENGEPSGALLLPLEESPLANTIGVACVLRTTDDRWVIARRAAASSVAYSPDMLGCVASGSVAWSEPHQAGAKGLESWLKEGMARECFEELGYRPERGQIQYLALCREFERAGKPQVFFFVDAKFGGPSVLKRDLESRWSMYAEREHVALHFLTDQQAKELAGNDAEAVGRVVSSLRLHGLAPSEELRANLALALQFGGYLGRS